MLVTDTGGCFTFNSSKEQRTVIIIYLQQVWYHSMCNCENSTFEFISCWYCSYCFIFLLSISILFPLCCSNDVSFSIVGLINIILAYLKIFNTLKCDVTSIILWHHTTSTHLKGSVQHSATVQVTNTPTSACNSMNTSSCLQMEEENQLRVKLDPSAACRNSRALTWTRGQAGCKTKKRAARITWRRISGQDSNMSLYNT